MGQTATRRGGGGSIADGVRVVTPALTPNPLSRKRERGSGLCVMRCDSRVYGAPDSVLGRVRGVLGRAARVGASGLTRRKRRDDWLRMAETACIRSGKG